MNESIQIGIKVLDKITKHEELITNITSNTIEVLLTKTSKKGIDSTHWFSERDFGERFQIIDQK